MALNPACTPGWTHRTSPSTVSAYCGCGWTADGFPSKTKAKAAQREHRFPPDACELCGAVMHPDSDDCPDDCLDACWGCDRTGQVEPGCPVHDVDEYSPHRDWGETGRPDFDALSSMNGELFRRPIVTVAVVDHYAV